MTEDKQATQHGFPNRLRIEDGELKMIDGSDVKEYLKGVEHLNGKDVVILSKEDADRLVLLSLMNSVG